MKKSSNLKNGTLPHRPEVSGVGYEDGDPARLREEEETREAARLWAKKMQDMA